MALSTIFSSAYSLSIMVKVGRNCLKMKSATLQVKVFAWLTLGEQIFRFRETIYKSSRQLQNSRRHGD